MTIFFIPLKIKKKIILVGMIFSFLSIFFITFEKTRERLITKTFNEIYVDKKIILFSYGHQSHFKSAILMVKKNLLTGVGPRNYRVECLKKDYEHIGKYRCNTHPHNIYLEVFAETGIVGFSIILFVFFYIVYYLFKLHFWQHKHEKIGLFFFSMVIFLNLFPFTTTGSFFNNWISFLYFFPIGFFLFEKNKQ